MRVGAFVEETNMETNTMKATSSFGPLLMGNVDTTEANGKNASWNEDGTGRDGSLNGIVGFALSAVSPQPQDRLCSRIHVDKA